MNSSSYDLNSSTGIPLMSEAILESNSNQPLITTNDIDISPEEKQLLSNQDNSPSSNTIPFELSPSHIDKKHKSLVSVYDNSNDSEQSPPSQQTDPNILPQVGIIGQNQRSQAFIKRLLLSSFPKPILYDINSNETFYHQSPSVILITDNSLNNFEHLFNPNKQPLIIDARELLVNKNSSTVLQSIPEAYRAFGNVSNREIASGTQRISVAIEQSSPLNLIKFIHNLNCFPRGIFFLDQYSYNNQRRKSFQNCLFPCISILIIFLLCFILSMTEYKNIFYQASSITASTSFILLSMVLLIRPSLELIEFIFKKDYSQMKFPRYWLQSRRYFIWYSLAFAILHLIFLIFSKNDFHQKFFFYPIIFGILSLILLCSVSFVYFPWISERLLWGEYHFLTAYLAPFCLLAAFIHVFIHWKYHYIYHNPSEYIFFHLKFLSMILPLIVLLLHFTLYGIIYPIIKLHNNRNGKNKTLIEKTKDITRLP